MVSSGCTSTSRGSSARRRPRGSWAPGARSAPRGRDRRSARGAAARPRRRSWPAAPRAAARGRPGVSAAQHGLREQVALPPAGSRQPDRHVDPDHVDGSARACPMSVNRCQLTPPVVDQRPDPAAAAAVDPENRCHRWCLPDCAPCACTSAPTTPVSSSRATSSSGCGSVGYEVVDHGPVEYDPVDDYPPYVLRAAVAVVNDPGSLGVVIGGSGNGEQIAANKVPGVRAALAWNDDTATPRAGAQRRQRRERRRSDAHARRGDPSGRAVPHDAVQRRRPARPADRDARRLREDRRAARAAGGPRSEPRLGSDPAAGRRATRACDGLRPTTGHRRGRGGSRRGRERRPSAAR